MALVLAGVALTLITGAGALVLWWLNADSQKTPAKDQTDSRGCGQFPRAGVLGVIKQAGGRTGRESSTNVAPTRRNRLSRLQPNTVVSPPVVSRQRSPTPGQKPDSTTIIRGQKGKGKKKAAKKSAKPSPNGRPTPLALRPWLARGQVLTGSRSPVVQQRDQLTATGISTDSKHREAHWRWIGTIDKEGHLNGRLLYTQAILRFSLTGMPLPRCPWMARRSRGPSGGKAALPDLPWKKAKPPGKKK